MDSARVTGSAAPALLHWIAPLPQSPVAQVPWPESSNLQSVLVECFFEEDDTREVLEGIGRGEQKLTESLAVEA